MVSSGRIINRKACSPFSDLMRSMESGGTGMAGDSWVLQIQRPSVLPAPGPFLSTRLLPLPNPHLCRSEAKAGVSTMISWIRTGIGQQFWKAARERGWSLGPTWIMSSPLAGTGSFLSRIGWDQ